MKQTCTYPRCHQPSVISGEHGREVKWQYAFCETHKRDVLPLLNNDNVPCRVPEKAIPRERMRG